ncbi:MAG: cysteine desulfurase, partial [Flavobacteriaceae bacterium]|nr:cysteine desulfurase [Flavobacteriaceae bacterium]
TSGGTEADNLVLRSAVKDLGIERIITSKIEHHAVLHTAEGLADEYGTEISFVRLDEKGLIDRGDLENLLKENKKTLVSLMHVNNEVGHMIDLKDMAALCKAYGALFHSDCVQSVGHFKIDVKEIPIDFFAASAHKFNGPKGVGFCFVRKGSALKPLIIGGEQERGLRAGTESIHNIVGLDCALDLAHQHMADERKHIEGLKYGFITKLKNALPGVKFNGSSADPENSTYTLVSVCLPVSPDKAAMLLFQLDLKGVACSKGSACQSGSDQGSHVLAEILDAEDLDKPSIRFSFGIYNDMNDIAYTTDVLKELVG